MKTIKEIKDCIYGTYYRGHLAGTVLCMLFNDVLLFNKNVNVSDKNRSGHIGVGDMIETDKYGRCPVTEALFGTHTKLLDPSTGWVTEIYRNKNRPGSTIIYRVLFHDGIFWISQRWVRKKE